ncbi:SpoVR family protein [uncultured Clostridium sp.]|uniref:SpoVR family protein n=1 Tax=uncultured Clostridium sp. TaxID=59620 RepID=UPI0028EE6E70|nr:SpoVR family protein [uncultured Clostridium sp.]
MQYTMKELEYWNNKIESKVEEFGLNCYPQEFEIVDYNNMLSYQVYLGMPSMYPHWSFGKNYDKLKTLYRHNLIGLPYEIVINSNPCTSYLLRENSLLMQILTMAHVYGHNDFFKNNRLYIENTISEDTFEIFKSHRDKIRGYIDEFGKEEVEKILDAVHSIKFQIDLLKFIKENGEMDSWQRDILCIVMEQSKYFIPQIETKIMNEGWASFWHYKILKNMELPQGLYLEFLDRHNAVVAPNKERINPYYLGFEIFTKLEEQYGMDKLFEVRAVERDESFIRRYLSKELCAEMNLFQYTIDEKTFIIEEISDEEGYKTIKDTFCKSVGMGSIPFIELKDIRNKTLVLEHKYDGRELDLNYAGETLKHIVSLWKHKVILKTKLNEKPIEVICSKDKEISYV